MGPDGQCVLCKRTPPSTPGWRSHGRAGLALALAVAASAALWIRSRYSHFSNGTGERSALVRALAPGAANRAEGASTPEQSPGGREHLVLSQGDPRSSARELGARGLSEIEGEFQAASESYELWAPPADGRAFGLLVWISAGPSGALENPEWKPALADHRLIWVGPNNAQNERQSGARTALAINAVRAARERHRIDDERVYIGGMSGGAKSAFQTLLAFPDIFRGALLACGIHYYRNIPAHSAGPDKTWFKRMNQPRELASAKSRRIVVVTGPNDFNFGHITDVMSAMHEDGFNSAEILSVPGLGHQRPPADAFAAALQQIDER